METYRKKLIQRQKKNIYYDFMKLDDSSKVPNLLKQLNSPHWSLPRYYLKDLSSIPTSTYCVVSSLLAAVVVPQFGFFLPLFCNTKLTFRPRGPVVPNSAAVAAATFVYSRCKVVVSRDHLVSHCRTIKRRYVQRNSDLLLIFQHSQQSWLIHCSIMICNSKVRR